MYLSSAKSVIGGQAVFQLYGCQVSLSECRSRVVRILLTAFILFFYSTICLAVKDNNITVVEEDGIYHINATAVLDVEPQYVRQVLTDYIHLYRINQSVIESEILPSPVNGHIRVRSRLLCCTSLFCMEVERVDDITTLESGELLAVIVPEKSDFLSGRALWQISRINDRTRLRYKADIQPDFFIPPVVGISMVKKDMREEFETAFNRIEKIARINAEREWNDDLLPVPMVETENTLPCGKRISTGLP